LIMCFGVMKIVGSSQRRILGKEKNIAHQRDRDGERDHMRGERMARRKSPLNSYTHITRRNHTRIDIIKSKYIKITLVDRSDARNRRVSHQSGIDKGGLSLQDMVVVAVFAVECVSIGFYYILFVVTYFEGRRRKKALHEHCTSNNVIEKMTQFVGRSKTGLRGEKFFQGERETQHTTVSVFISSSENCSERTS